LSVLVLLSILVFEVMLLLSSFRRFRDPGLQHETDIRLTYKRYKELYPTSTLSYKQYKELQTEKAFKRSVSSRKIRRMVK